MANATTVTPKPKRRKKLTLPSIDQAAKTTERVDHVSKYREWKFLYYKKNGKNGSLPSESQIKYNANGDVLVNYQGLCKTCKISTICPLAMTEGGIWRCEDYR